MGSLKKFDGSSWINSNLRKLTTDTDTFTTFPAIIYAEGTNATVGLKGNTVQSSTPSPDSPVMPQGTGDLETVGTKAGQYKIPISSANTTTPVYLGEVETTRRIKKLVLTGEESSWTELSPYYTVSADNVRPWSGCICTHCAYNGIIGGNSNARLWINRASFPDYQTLEDFKAYLTQQYAAGTPVTVWYVLANEETGIVNEPLMKIGDYADTVSSISIPITTGGDTLSVGTTVQPSEVTANYYGWHTITVHERESGQWD